MFALSKKLALKIEDAIGLEAANNILRRIRPGKEAKTEEEKTELIAYGIQVLLGTLVKLLIILSLAALLGSYKPTLVMVLVFMSFRSIAGGQHMDTYKKCLILSVFLFLVFGLLAQYITWSTTIKNIIFVLVVAHAFYTCLLYVPVTHPNHPVRVEKQKKLKKLSFVYIAVFTFTMLLIKSNRTVVAASFALFLECFTIVPFGYNIFSRLSGGMK